MKIMAFPASDLQDVAPDEIDANVVRMIGLVQDLITVIGEENRLLASGVPASLSSSVSLKASLSLQLEGWTTGVHAQPLLLARASPHLRQELVEASTILSAAMDENITRIKAAIDATGSRVNAIMGAIREQAETDIAYRPNGTLGTIVRQPAPTAGRLA